MFRNQNRADRIESEFRQLVAELERQDDAIDDLYEEYSVELADESDDSAASVSQPQQVPATFLTIRV
ncbi:MAG: hypothetical protein R3A47_02550 [Polyangiales bacterium]